MNTTTISSETLTEIMQAVDAVYTQLEAFTPPEALDILRIVQAGLKGEIWAMSQWR